jgi:NAD(P)-dependent dehydrogenase (short-subunit alcohol dehydrogenase family)
LSLSQDFEGKVAIVTGAARGIGATISNSLIARGAVVAAADLLPAQSWENQLTAPNSKHFVDVRSKQSCLDLVQSVISEHGRIDYLVNNAGIVRRAKASEVAEKDFTDVIDINLNGTFFMSQAIYAELKKTKGAIVNIGSTSGHPWVTNLPF